MQSLWCNWWFKRHLSFWKSTIWIECTLEGRIWRNTIGFPSLNCGFRGKWGYLNFLNSRPDYRRKTKNIHLRAGLRGVHFPMSRTGGSAMTNPVEYSGNSISGNTLNYNIYVSTFKDTVQRWAKMNHIKIDHP